ncbi:hypothetical protein Fmac_016088 [Flemingia macrophylla]|uniref:Retrotransposon gag domain-containing protein n=1 Tax=Flemingia macrophylla TaxID=520843 RepID=A0ABD1MGD7_9FABA
MANNRRNSELTEAMQAIGEMAAALLQQGLNHGTTETQGLIEFRRNKPTQFNGEYGPEKAELWIREIEKIFYAMNCTDKQKITYSVFMLVGEAENWWDNTKRLLEGQGVMITWDIFRTKFLEKYFPNDVRREKEIEFMQLKQGNMTVGQYAAKLKNQENILPSFTIAMKG